MNVELGTLSDRVKTAQQEQDRLRTSIRDTVLSSNLTNDVMVKIYELQQESSVAKTLYQDLLQRLRGALQILRSFGVLWAQSLQYGI